MSDAAAVTAFLSDFRTAAATYGLTIWSNKKNDDFRNETGATNEDIHDIINSLSYRHYNGGPEDDIDGRRTVGEVWKFSVEWCGYDLYMKLKLSGAKAVPLAECLSCHERERDMREPLRSKRSIGAR